MDPSPGCEIRMHPPHPTIDGILDITLHHASDIPNICIYGNQDVYAKFSITQAQDTVYSTQPARGGGKNPVFNQNLQMLISKADSVLKCELWMMSCARNYLEDQLLGFVLVPLCNLLGMGKLMCDYTLTSTELFHTPAGTVRLSLLFFDRCAQPFVGSAISNVSKLCEYEDGLNLNTNTVENGNEQTNLDSKIRVDYNCIEFPDLQTVSENQQLVSIFMKMVPEDSKLAAAKDVGASTAEKQGASESGSVPVKELDPPIKDLFQYNVHDKVRGSNPARDGDSEMVLYDGAQESIETAKDSSAWPSYTEGIVRDGVLPSPHKLDAQADIRIERVSNLMRSKTFNSSACNRCPDSISSSAVEPSVDDNLMGQWDGQESGASSTDQTPLTNISLDPEVPVVQQQIVDMYMKSMQQFTESLAKMRLPFDIDLTQQSLAEHSSASQQLQQNGAVSDSALKDQHRVFYGSGAFF